MAFTEGILVGLSMIIFIGPVFFTLLKSTLEHGKFAGFAVASGIIISDVTCIAVCLLGAIPFFDNDINQFWIGLTGSIILLALGLKYLIKPNAEHNSRQLRVKNVLIVSFFTKGFLVNFINPFVFLVWIGLITYAKSEFIHYESLFIFLGGALLGIFSTDLLKVILADKIKRLIQPKVLRVTYRIIGIILIGFAIRIFLYVML